MGGGTSTNTVQNSDPWSGAQPYLLDVMRNAQQTYNNAQGQTQIPGLSPTTQTALGDIATRAQAGSPVTGAADTSLTNILNGTNGSPGNAALSTIANSGLNNPALTAAFQAAAQPVTDAVNAQFGLAGRTGSVANQQALTRDLGQVAANIYLPAQQNQITAANALNANQNTQNQQQIQGAAIAPSLANADYNDLQNLLTSGQLQDQYNTNAFNYQQQQPWNILQGYTGAVSGLGGLGGTTTSSTPGSSNSSLLGGGLMAASLLLPFL